jgi:penicillin-binding protein 1C
MSTPAEEEESPADRLRRLAASGQPSAETPESAPAEPPAEPEEPSDDLDQTEPWHPPTAHSAPTLRNVAIDDAGMPILSAPTRRARLAPRFEEPLPVNEPVDIPGARRQRTAPLTFRRALSCFGNVLVYGLVVVLVMILLGLGGLGFGYWYIARDLPPIGDLQARASTFETARVYDAQGNLLYDILDPQAGRRTRVPLARISPYLIAATIATEDQNFYSHPGFDPLGIARAIWQNVQAGDTVSGASTITQQLVRALVLSPEERAQRTNLRKIREIVLASEITRRYTKDQILELYLNEIYYGNLAYGIEAAAETYFNKKASDLNLAEASFLAGLPQAPAVYDIYTNPEAATERQRDVLSLMLAKTNEAGGIQVYIGEQERMVAATANDVRDALFYISQYTFTPPRSTARFPHWVNYVRQIIENQYGAQTLYRSGFNIYTTLDPDLQTLAEAIVAEQVATLADRNVTNGALVALRPNSGAIVVMVGSENYDDPVDGQINMAIRPRQPGSSIKPLTYALAFERGWTPATLVWDVPTAFPDGANPPYQPVNYDGRFHGPVLVRGALANSYNIPAVKALQFVGVYGQVQNDAAGNPVEAVPGLISFMEKLGVTTLTRTDYGLALTLGGGEVPLHEMVQAYGALASGGRRVFPFAISQITDLDGKVICQQPLTPADLKTDPPACQTPPETWGQTVISPETAFLISDILSDNAARTPAFGPNSPLRLSFPAAVKTGTTNDYRDNWTIGYTPDLVAGVWVGNADFTPMQGTSGVTGAAPIWRQFMEQALAGKATPFVRPASLIEREVCAISGAEPGEFCPPDQRRIELFAADKPPLPRERDLWQRAFIDPFTGLRQTEACAQAYQTEQLYTQEKLVIGVTDVFAQKWLTEDPNGKAWAEAHNIIAPVSWAPSGDCTLDSPRPIISIAYPPEGATLNPGPLEIRGQAGATKDFDHFIIEYGLSHAPEGWGGILGPTTNAILETNVLANWDAGAIQDGPIAIRVIVFNKSGGSAEARVRFTFQRPTPTPAPTEPPTATPTVTLTPTITSTSLPSATPTPTLPAPTPTDTAPTPSEIPTETAPPPTETPTATPSPP